VFYSDRGSPFIRITNMSRNSIYLDLTDIKYVNLPPEAKEGTRTRLQKHDVLISITADIGIVGYVTSDVPLPAYINQHIALVRFDPSSTDGRFVSYFLASENPQKLFRAFTDTGAKAGMSLVTVQKLKAAFPPLYEQHAIAGALGDVDELIGALTRLIAKKRDLKQAAMQQLLTGQTRLPGFSGKWEVKLLGDGVSLLSGHHVLVQLCNLRGDGVPYLTGPADFPNGIIEQTRFTERPSTLCRPNDILVTVKGSGSGRLVVADAVYCISRQLMAIRVHEWDSRFIYYSLFQNVRPIKAASAGLIPGLSRSDILEQLLPIPPVREQAAIAAVLSDMDAEIEALERRLVKTRALKQGMMQELLTGRTRLI